MTSTQDTIRVGSSACIVGQEVRFNGGNKLDRFTCDTQGTDLEFVPVSPEVKIGLGVPRETLRPLIGPDTLMRHHLRHHRIDSLADQSHLSPHPRERMLGNAGPA